MKTNLEKFACQLMGKGPKGSFLRPMIRPKITLTKEKERKNSKNEENEREERREKPRPRGPFLKSPEIKYSSRNIKNKSAGPG